MHGGAYVSITLMFLFLFLPNTISNNFSHVVREHVRQGHKPIYPGTPELEWTGNLSYAYRRALSAWWGLNFKHRPNVSLMAEFVGLSVSFIVSTMSEQRMAVYDLLNVLKMYDGTIGHGALF